MSTRNWYRICLTIAAIALAVATAGCSGTDGNGEGNGEDCDEPTLQHSPPPFSFREAHPPGDEQENRGQKDRTPFESTFHLISKCNGEAIEVEKTCLVDEGEEAGDDKTTEQFTIEGPEPTTATQEQDAIVRLTYNREEPNQGDDVDNAAMVVQSNAANLPTLVVPICGRVVPEDQDRAPGRVSCDSPIERPTAGEKVEGLCDN